MLTNSSIIRNIYLSISSQGTILRNSELIHLTKSLDYEYLQEILSLLGKLLYSK